MKTLQLSWWARWLFVLPALIWTVAFFIVPFVFMVIMSLWQRIGSKIIATWNLDNYIEFVTKPHLVKALTNSLEISLSVTVISVLLAYPLAWIIAERVPARWQRMALILAILPF